MFSKMLMFAATVAIAGDAAAGQRGARHPDTSTYDDWSEQAFRSLDRNGDGRLTRVEWAVDQVAFRRADHNGDGIVTRREFLGEQDGDDAFDDQNGAEAEAQRFDRLDVDGDGRIARDEWRDGRAVFDRLDENRDGRLTRAELFAEDSAGDRFEQLDTDRNGAVTRGEWTGSAASFTSLDVNRDGRLSRAELTRGNDGVAGDPGRDANRSPAYRAGYQRGLTDGRLAGREDRQRNQGFDLDGQRELDTADAGYDGYDGRAGSRADYQAGYRAAFRIAYREGYGAR